MTARHISEQLAGPRARLDRADVLVAELDGLSKAFAASRPYRAVQLDDPNVSRYHAEIRPAGEGYVVADLGSTNGTKVNGVEVTERPLRDGDEVVVGATRLLFHAS